MKQFKQALVYTTLYYRIRGQGSVVGIATCYRWEQQGIESWWGRDFLHISRPVLGPTQPPVQWLPGLSRRVKVAGA